MKVLLLQHIKGLGQKGEIKEVSDGYFRNMLAPKKLAAEATQGKVNALKHQQAKATEKLEAIKESAESIKTKIGGKSITITEKASDTGKLYAAVSPKEVAEAIKAEHKLDVPVKTIAMDEHIKEAGDFPITLKLHKGVSAEITLHVIAK